MYELTEDDKKLVDEAMASLRRITEHKILYENTSDRTRSSLVEDIIRLYDNVESEIESLVESLNEIEVDKFSGQMSVLRIETESYLRGMRNAKQMIDDYLDIEKLKSEG